MPSPFRRARADGHQTRTRLIRSAAPDKLADNALRAQEMGKDVALFR
jgi:hypothetical protein